MDMDMDMDMDISCHNALSCAVPCNFRESAATQRKLKFCQQCKILEVEGVDAIRFRNFVSAFMTAVLAIFPFTKHNTECGNTECI
jgi:hypothetical protein